MHVVHNWKVVRSSATLTITGQVSTVKDIKITGVKMVKTNEHGVVQAYDESGPVAHLVTA